MSSPTTSPFGTWKSPISIEAITGGGTKLSESEYNTSNGNIYYIESRPAEQGRCVIVENSQSGARDVLPEGYSARSSVHEYGGAAMTVSPNGLLIFSDFGTRGVFSMDPESGHVKPLIDSDENIRFADFDAHPKTSEWVLAIREVHHGEEVLNSMVVLNSETKKVRTLAKESDFYAQPKFNPAGDQISWLEWNHPDMPWTGTVLYVAKWDNGSISQKTRIAGKAGSESISQPRWNFNGSLYFVSDRTGFWQLYQHKPGFEVQAIKLEGLETWEFSQPDWQLGSCTYVPLTEDTIAASVTKNAADSIIILNSKTGTYTDPKFSLVEISLKSLRRVSETEFLTLGMTPTKPLSLYILDVNKPGVMRLLASSFELDVPEPFLSKATHVSYPRLYKNKDGQGHCFFFPPRNPDFVAPSGSLPPLIITLHGGPTSRSGPGMNLETQYWTTRGYAVAAINYAGSSGYGRAYRDSLNGQWGVSDVEDTANAIAHLSAHQLIDPRRVGIIGGSAGGYAVLAALCDHAALFAGGVSLYGISDVAALIADTHKFESRYADALLFPAGAGDRDKATIMAERSPCHRAGRIRAPLLLLQGDRDAVVPPNQAREMERAIEERGGVVRLVMFEGEGHGFRARESLVRAKREEEAWWRKTLLGLNE